MVPRLLIMCGTSGVGKSTLSTNLASSLNFGKIVSTDTIREVLRTQISSTESPALHRSSFEPAGGSASEDWKEAVRALSEGVLAVIERAASKGSDLLLEGVHYVPNNEVIDLWREAGGVATGVVLYVSSEDRHRGMIANRERHNGKKLDHYLGNMDRIREIQEELVLTGSEIDWLVIDPTKESDSIGLISSSLY